MLNPGIKSRIASIFGILRCIFHWGFIPGIIYLGISTGSEPGMPEVTISSLLWA